jgi:hypothetical protein
LSGLGHEIRVVRLYSREAVWRFVEGDRSGFPHGSSIRASGSPIKERLAKAMWQVCSADD